MVRFVCPPARSPASWARPSRRFRRDRARQGDNVAAVAKSGYQRTRDVEGAGGVMQWFDNGSHLSKITAECSNGSVHAEVEEENAGGD